MTAFNFFSHGTQDLYPTFLQVQHGFGPHEVGLIAVIYNVGAIIGGISFGSLSERFGRRRIIIIAAVLSLVVLPLWAFAASAVWLAIGAFLMQVMVQGAWGVIPVHLNECHPTTRVGRSPDLSISSAILSRRSTQRCKPALQLITAAIMPWHSRSSRVRLRSRS